MVDEEGSVDKAEVSVFFKIASEDDFNVVGNVFVVDVDLIGTDAIVDGVDDAEGFPSFSL